MGQDCFGTSWTRRIEQRKKKMSEFGGQEGLCDLRNDERETLGRTRTQDYREIIKPKKERKEPRKLEPPDSSIAIHSEGTTVQMCRDSNVAEKSINGHYSMGQKFQGTI